MNRKWLAGAMLAVLVAALYSVSAGHNFLFDEENLVISNPYIKDLRLIPELFRHGFFFFRAREVPLWTEYYRPITSVTFAIDFHFWKGNPLGYNLTNMALHAAVCVLLFRFLLKAIRHFWAAFLAALLYTVHPIHVEAVTYIASRSDLLAGVFTLSVLLLYWNGKTRLALLPFTFSLFTKESMSLVPAYLVLLELCFIRSRPKEALRKILPFVLVVALFIFYRKFFCPVPLGPASITPGWFLRMLSIGPQLLSYWDAFFFPQEFKFSQEIFYAARFSSPVTYVTLTVLGALGVLWLLFLKRRQGAFFGLNLFFIALLPSLQIVQFYPEWCEHYLYIPAMGLVTVLGAFMKEIFESRRRWIAAFLACYVPFMGFLSFRTWQRNTFYNDATVFYEKLTQTGSPYAFYGHQNIARLLIEKNDWDGAIPLVKTALKISPYSDMSWQLLGRCYMEKKKYALAEQCYRRACELDPENNDFFMNLGNALISLKRYKQAAEVFEKVRKRHPRYYFVYMNLAAAYELGGDLNKAKATLEEGLRVAHGDRLESAILRSAVIRQAYRQGWDEVWQSETRKLLETAGDFYWYGDVARLLTGKMDEEEFLRLLPGKYHGFEPAGRQYVLMAYALHGKKEKLVPFLKMVRQSLDEKTKAHPLSQKELRRVHAALRHEDAHP